MAKSNHGRQSICAMSENDADKSSKRILAPIERISEVLFGLIMVPGFTGLKTAAQDGRADIRTRVFGASGCNLSWGLIDGIQYLMDCLGEPWESLALWFSGTDRWAMCQATASTVFLFVGNRRGGSDLSWIHGLPAEARCQ
jgi:hypothetical protein